MKKYTIKSREAGGEWVWAGDGDTRNGTTAILPDEVYALADSGEEGEITVGGISYRVEHTAAD